MEDMWSPIGVWFVILMVVNPGVGAIIGQRKNRILAGIFFGLFLGPIGWIIVGFGPSCGPKCPECKGDVILGARRCKNCGSVLDANCAKTEHESAADKLINDAARASEKSAYELESRFEEISRKYNVYWVIYIVFMVIIFLSVIVRK